MRNNGKGGAQDDLQACMMGCGGGDGASCWIEEPILQTILMGGWRERLGNRQNPRISKK